MRRISSSTHYKIKPQNNQIAKLKLEMEDKSWREKDKTEGNST